MTDSDHQDRRMMQHGRGLGVPTPEAVEQRARELAETEGRRPHEVTSEDRSRAHHELTDTPTDRPAQPEDGRLSAARDPAHMAIDPGHENAPQPESDEQNMTAREVLEGVEEAEHERMVAAQESEQGTIALACDHAGYTCKEEIRAMLEERGYAVRDFGTHSSDPVDYPPFTRAAATAVAAGDCDRAVVLGGSGNGEAMVANKVGGIRCAVCWSVESARLAKEHNNANVIAIGQRMMTLETALQVVETWLSAEFQGGRHARRIALIES